MADGQLRNGYCVISDNAGADSVHKPDALKRHKS
jgi:hypothetical protein